MCGGDGVSKKKFSRTPRHSFIHSFTAPSPHLELPGSAALLDNANKQDMDVEPEKRTRAG